MGQKQTFGSLKNRKAANLKRPQLTNNTLSRFQIGLSITVTGMFLSACIWILSMCIASLESGLTEKRLAICVVPHLKCKNCDSNRK